MLRLTVGRDPELDLRLVPWDCLASEAHAEMLAGIGVLSEEELAGLRAELRTIAEQAVAADFRIETAEEDGHTAIEARLTERCGDAGGKIHTGRSRNDQVATAMRLFMRYHAVAWADLLADFLSALQERARRDGAVHMPGYTHLQPAMPSSVGQWLHAVAEAGMVTRKRSGSVSRFESVSKVSSPSDVSS